MRKKNYSSEELSQLFDLVNFEGSQSNFNDLSKESQEEYQRLEKTITILNAFGKTEIGNKDLFCERTLKGCRKAISYPFGAFSLKKYLMPGAAAAAVAVAVLSFGVFNTGAKHTTDKMPIASVISREESFEIIAQYVSDIDKLESIVAENNGTVIERSKEKIIVKAKVSDYLAMKKEMTLSAEEKVFLKNDKKLVSVGSDSKLFSKDKSKVITFTISPKR